LDWAPKTEKHGVYLITIPKTQDFIRGIAGLFFRTPRALLKDCSAEVVTLDLSHPISN
jgi:hypothetical protein